MSEKHNSKKSISQLRRKCKQKTPKNSKNKKKKNDLIFSYNKRKSLYKKNTLFIDKYDTFLNKEKLFLLLMDN